MGSGTTRTFNRDQDKATFDARAGDRLRRLRRARGLTQEDLAEATGVSRSAVAQWETGRAGHLSRLRQIAEALDVPVRELRRPGSDPIPFSAGAPSREEGELLRNFRSLDAQDQVCFSHLVRRLTMIDPGS